MKRFYFFFFPVFLTAVLLNACTSPVEPDAGAEPVITVAPTTAVAPNATLAASPAGESISSPTFVPSPTAKPMSDTFEGWSLYRNDRYGYEFSYPPAIFMLPYQIQDPPLDEKPSDLTTAEYTVQLQTTYPDICVRMEFYEGGYIFVSTPPNADDKYITCSPIDMVAYEVISKTETVPLGEQMVIATGFELYQDNTYEGEVYTIELANGMQIEYGIQPGSTTQDSNKHFSIKEVTQQILTSFRFDEAASVAAVTPTPIPLTCPELPTPRSVPAAGPLRVYYNKEGNIHLWEEASGTTTALTTFGDVTRLYLSDDGQRLAFLREIKEKQGTLWLTPVALWVMDSNGQNQQQLLSVEDLLAIGNQDNLAAVMLYDLAWVPGSHTLAFNPYAIVAGDGLGGDSYLDELRLLDVDSEEQTVLIPRGQGGNFAYSPNGRYIALTTGTEATVVHADGSNRQDGVLTYDAVGLGHSTLRPPVTWHPNGQSFNVAIAAEDPFAEDATFTTWRITAADGHATQLGTFNGFPLPNFGTFGSAVFAPDLSQIAFTQQSTPTSNTRQLYIAGPANEWQVHYFTGYLASFLGWAPDGVHFTFQAADEPLHVGQLCQEPIAVDGPAAAGDTGTTWVDAQQFIYLSGDTPGNSDLYAIYDLILGSSDGTARRIDQVQGSFNSYAVTSSENNE